MRIACLVLLSAITLATICFILFNSSFDSKESWSASDTVSEQFVEPLIKAIVPSSIQDGGIAGLSYGAFTRKLAHFIEYLVLGMELAGLVFIHSTAKAVRAPWQLLLYIPLFFSLFIAVIDEYLQSFTGRTSLVSDVLLNFFGSIFGIAILTIIVLAVKHMRRHRAC